MLVSVCRLVRVDELEMVYRWWRMRVVPTAKVDRENDNRANQTSLATWCYDSVDWNVLEYDVNLSFVVRLEVEEAFLECQLSNRTYLCYHHHRSRKVDNVVGLSIRHYQEIDEERKLVIGNVDNVSIWIKSCMIRTIPLQLSSLQYLRVQLVEEGHMNYVGEDYNAMWSICTSRTVEWSTTTIP